MEAARLLGELTTLVAPEQGLGLLATAPAAGDFKEFLAHYCELGASEDFPSSSIGFVDVR